MSTIVVMPGGFHPFHAGHAALYNSARRAFPDAEVFVAATNDTSNRPFPFAIKEKLAKLAGVEPGHFVQVKSPFQAKEITAGFNPEVDRLIFVRSEKDASKPPQAGGVKKDGNPAYLQPLLGAKKLEPFGKRAYMAYLPTVEFGPGMTSATEIRTAWPQLNDKRKQALVMSLYPKTQSSPALAANVVKMLDTAMGTESVDEAISRRGFLKGAGAAAAAGAAGKASAIAGAFPTPSHQAAMYKAAADSNAAQARADAAAKAKADAKRLQQGTQDVERLNKVNYHGGNSPKPTNAEWDGDSDFLDLDGTQYAKASRMPISGDVPSDLTLVSTKEGRQVYIWTRRSLKGTHGRYFYPADNPKTINEFAPDDSGGSRKFIPWTEFIEQVKQIVSKDFSCKENVVKSTIKARFVPHDPMEYGPTMLYSYYETRAGGRNKGAVSTRGSIQVGKYFDKGSYFNSSDPDIQNQLLTSFNLLKGHPFERHFDLTFDNIYKIANIIMGNTEGAYQMPQQQGVAETLAGVSPQGFVGGMHAAYQDRENQPTNEDYLDE